MKHRSNTKFIFLHMLFWFLLLATANLADFQKPESNLFETARQVLEQYATSIRNGDLHPNLAPNFTMRHCNWSILLTYSEIHHRLAWDAVNIPTRNFRIVSAAGTNGTLSRFSAQILPYMSVNYYEVRRLENGTYQITSELHNNCKIQPLTTSLINDDQLAMDMVREFYKPSKQDVWERYGHVEPVENDVVFNFSIRINSEIKNFRAKHFDGDWKYLVEDRDKEDFHHIEPEHLVKLYRIAEYTGSRRVFDEIFAENISIFSCDNIQYFSRDEFYLKVISHYWYSFDENSVMILRVLKYSNKTMKFYLRANNDCDKEILVDKDSKIAGEYHLSCKPKIMELKWQDMKQRHHQANLALLAEELLSKYQEAIKTKNTECLEDIVSKHFEIRNLTDDLTSSTIYTYNSTPEIFDKYPSNFTVTVLRVVGVYQWRNGTIIFRTMGTGVENLYQTVLKDGKHYMEYERRDPPRAWYSLKYFSRLAEMDK